MDTHGYSNGHFSEKYVKGVAWSTQEKSWATRATNIQKKVINHCHSWATRANKHIEKIINRYHSWATRAKNIQKK